MMKYEEISKGRQEMKIIRAVHGTVMSHAGADRIPAAVESARKMGLKFQHYGWPGITRTKEGDILVSASERILHVDPFGRSVVVRSSDGGHSWSEPVIVFDSDADDRDSQLLTLKDGTVVCSWFSCIDEDWKWKKPSENIKPDTLSALPRGWLRRSHDGGRTWEKEVYPTIVGQHAGPSLLSNGDMLQCGPAAGPDGKRLVATRSTDGGLSWSIIGEIPCEKILNKETGITHARFNESHALEIAPGKIICVFRPRIYIARSNDGGITWTQPEDIGVYGYPSYLLRLSAGPILCVFSDRRQPKQAIRGVLSYDDGKTWDIKNILTLREFEQVTDMGYPVAVELNPGEIFCVYYSVPIVDKTPDYQYKTPDYEHYDPKQTGILSTRMWLK
jgi:hypothetical protein